MNKKQKDSLAKYLYDISKGLILAAAGAALLDEVDYFVVYYVVLAGLSAFYLAHEIEGE